MTESIVAMMKTKLGDDFTKQEQDAWVEVFAVLIEDIIEAQNALSIEEASKNKAVVADTWKKFTQIPNHEEVGGVVLFSQYVVLLSDKVDETDANCSPRLTLTLYVNFFLVLQPF